MVQLFLCSFESMTFMGCWAWFSTMWFSAGIKFFFFFFFSPEPSWAALLWQQHFRIMAELSTHINLSMFVRREHHFTGRICKESVNGIKYSRQFSILAYHYGGVRICIQPANKSVSLCVDGAFALDGFLIHRLAVHVQSDLVTLHANHHLVPLGVEEHRQAREGDGLQVAIGTHQKVLQSLLVAVQPQSGLFVAVFVDYLPDIPHLVHCVLDHAEGRHEGVFIRETTGKVQPEKGIRKQGSSQLKYQSITYYQQNVQVHQTQERYFSMLSLIDT